MLFVLVTLWTIMGILLIIDPRSGTTRWLSAVVFCGGAGALAAVVGQDIIPYVQERYGSQSLRHFLFYIQSGASLTSYYGVPYAFLMFAVHYRRLAIPGLWRAGMPYLLLIPALVSLWYTPEYTEEYPVHFRAIIWWVLPYIGIGTVLILSRQEWTRVARRIHWMTTLAVLPAVLFSAVMNYVLPSFGYYQMWKYNIWIIAFGFAVFLIAIFNYGFMGIRVLIQKRQLDSTLRAITSGTAILNHAIKNDVGKMQLFCEKINTHALQTEQQELADDIRVIMGAANHIQEMIRRVHHQTQDLTLRTKVTDLSQLLDHVVQSLEPGMVKQGIIIDKDYPEGVFLLCDSVQLSEALTNVMTNAGEAMPAGGKLTLRIRQSKKSVEIEITDSGVGIKHKELAMVFEPFFTTKADSKNNFGLGLAYSYHVAKKHGGTLSIISAKGQGTTVMFRLPRKTFALEGLLTNRGAAGNG